MGWATAIVGDETAADGKEGNVVAGERAERRHISVGVVVAVVSDLVRATVLGRHWLRLLEHLLLIMVVLLATAVLGFKVVADVILDLPLRRFPVVVDGSVNRKTDVRGRDIWRGGRDGNGT